MDIKEYTELKLDQKAQILWDNGQYVDDRVIYNKAKVVIYSLYQFYVEVYYSVKNNEIFDIKVLGKEEDWSGYLDSINLDHLWGE